MILRVYFIFPEPGVAYLYYIIYTFLFNELMLCEYYVMVRCWAGAALSPPVAYMCVQVCISLSLALSLCLSLSLSFSLSLSLSVVHSLFLFLSLYI